MDFSVTIVGLDQLASASADIRQAVADQINAGVYAAAQQIRTEAIKSIQDGEKTGRIYNRGSSKKVVGTKVSFGSGGASAGGAIRKGFHQASAPGEAPASDTGALASRGIVAALSGPGEATATAGGNGVIYASMLEFGTSRIAPRPFMIPALEKSKDWIVSRLQEAVRLGLARSK